MSSLLPEREGGPLVSNRQLYLVVHRRELRDFTSRLETVWAKHTAVTQGATSYPIHVSGMHATPGCDVRTLSDEVCLCLPVCVTVRVRRSADLYKQQILSPAYDAWSSSWVIHLRVRALTHTHTDVVHGENNERVFRKCAIFKPAVVMPTLRSLSL